METSVQIRPVSDNDLNALIGTYIACFAEPPWFERFTRAEVRADFEQILAHPETLFLVAEVGGEPVGAIIAFHLCRKPDVFCLVPNDKRNSLYLAELFVRRDCRRYRLAERLSRACLEIANAAGFRDAVVRTSTEQFIVLKLYQRLGFSEIAAQDVVSRKVIEGVERDIPDRRVILTGPVSSREMSLAELIGCCGCIE